MGLAIKTFSFMKGVDILMKISKLIDNVREYCIECYERGECAITLWKATRGLKRINKRLQKLSEHQKEAEEAFQRLKLWSEGGNPYED